MSKASEATFSSDWKSCSQASSALIMCITSVIDLVHPCSEIM